LHDGADATRHSPKTPDAPLRADEACVTVIGAPVGPAPSRPASRKAVDVRFVVLAAAVVLVHASGVEQLRDPLMLVASAGVTLRVAVMLARGRLAVPRPWWWVTAGLAHLTANNAVWFVQVDLGGAETATGPVPLLALPLGYLCLLVGSVVLIVPAARRDFGGVLDAALVAVGGAIVLWTLWLFPALESRDVPTTARVYDLAVVLVVSGITGAVIRAIASARAARASLTYVLVAVLCTLAGNAVGVVTADPVTGRTPGWLGILWVVGYLALGSAAAHPSSAALAAPGRPWEGRLTTRRLVYLGLALAANPLVAAARELTGGEADWLLLSLGSLVLVPLVLLRVWQLARLHADAERRLAHLADHDPLTGLPNRRALEHHLERLVGRVGAGAAPGAVVVFVDLDDFKTVNDTYGHRVGDALLAEVGARLRRCARDDGRDLVARFAGDEFVLVLEGGSHLARAAAERVEAALGGTVDVGGHTLRVGGSVGVAHLPGGATATAEDLLCAADARMYEHKDERRAARSAG
jgi:diguanylate cyclase (GGDEF)-like protein